MTPKNLLIACFKSLGAAYKAVQLADSDIDVLEVFPLGPQGHVIFTSESPLVNLMKRIQDTLAVEITSMNHIAECPVKVLRAYLSVENAELDKDVLIVEAGYVGELMSSAALAVNEGLQIVDLRMLRGSSSTSYLFLTGDETALQGFAAAAKLKTTLIKNANQHIRALFNI